MNEEIAARDWRLIESLARQLTSVDPNAIAKLQVYLRTTSDVSGCESLLNSLAKNANQFLRMPREQRQQHGVSFIRREPMARGYQTASQTLHQLFTSGHDAQTQARLLGWVVRLIRYYNSEAAAEFERPGRSDWQRTDRRGVSSQEVEVPAPKPLPKPAKPIVKKPQPQTSRELITLIGDAKTGKARVRVSTGEEITCTGIPPYPPASVGDTCYADVVREKGRAVKATFKVWHR
jgi:hypothetical protein